MKPMIENHDDEPGDKVLHGKPIEDLQKIAGELVELAAKFSQGALRQYLTNFPSHLILAKHAAPTMHVRVSGVADVSQSKRVGLWAAVEGIETELLHVEFNLPTAAGKTLQ